MKDAEPLIQGGQGRPDMAPDAKAFASLPWLLLAACAGLCAMLADLLKR